jgi:hypothetical protein
MTDYASSEETAKGGHRALLLYGCRVPVDQEGLLQVLAGGFLQAWQAQSSSNRKQKNELEHNLNIEWVTEAVHTKSTSVMQKVDCVLRTPPHVAKPQHASAGKASMDTTNKSSVCGRVPGR